MKTAHPLHFTIHSARDGWRWRVTRNGRILACSNEAYVRRASCLRTLSRFLDSVAAKAFTLSVEPVKR